MKECLAYTWMEKRERERERKGKWKREVGNIQNQGASCQLPSQSRNRLFNVSVLDIKTTKRAHTETTWKM